MPRHFPAGKRVKPAPAGNPQRAGFTLVELLIGASLSAAIMAAVLSSYIYMGRNLTRLGNQQILETEARRTLGYFAQDVQAAMSVSVATGLTAPSFQVTFLVISGGGSTRQIIYFYNSTGSPITRSISGNNVTIPANSLIRIVSTGSAIIPPIQTLLRNIVSTSDGCYIRFFDSSGNASDNGNAPYTARDDLSYRNKTGRAGLQHAAGQCQQRNPYADLSSGHRAARTAQQDFSPLVHPAAHSSRGTVSLVALCFVVVLGIVLGSYLAACSRAMNLSNRSFQSTLSQQLAEFGPRGRPARVQQE